MIAPGYIIPELRTVARIDAMPLWAAALHDPNPIHLDSEAARAAGLGDRVINQGPINIGYLVNALVAAFPGGVLERIDVRFLANVHGGDLTIASGVVTRVTEASGVLRLECDLRLTVAGAGDVLAGSAAISLPYSASAEDIGERSLCSTF